ncbi:MAG: hypothetical protein DSM106950_27810 [Stigonema ocellatum SAG 48.90 = DSM 106950]|nr:hypothetical protein [Stigonema ocellatum SAG 48.90 = DSM 106950]
MHKVFIEEIFDVPEQEEKNALPATDEDLIALGEKFSGFEIPIGVFLQAIAIADYDAASAFRYADNYLTILKNADKSKNPHPLQ